MNALDKRIARLEDRAPCCRGLEVLETHELVLLRDALQEEDSVKRVAMLAALQLCPRSQHALIDAITIVRAAI
jgi:hypothetical protein